MAAPTVTARGTPAGRKMPDGFSTTIAFANDTVVQIWEKTVKPPGIDGGDKIEQTTMLNSQWRTMAPRSLKTLTDAEAEYAYDPDCLSRILNLINVRQSITVKFPDGTTLAFYGYLQKFEPDTLEEGKQPTAKGMIIPTNYDPVNNVEAGPLITEAAGT